MSSPRWPRKWNRIWLCVVSEAGDEIRLVESVFDVAAGLGVLDWNVAILKGVKEHGSVSVKYSVVIEETCEVKR